MEEVAFLLLEQFLEQLFLRWLYENASRIGCRIELHLKIAVILRLNHAIRGKVCGFQRNAVAEETQPILERDIEAARFDRAILSHCILKSAPLLEHESRLKWEVRYLILLFCLYGSDFGAPRSNGRVATIRTDIRNLRALGVECV